MHAGAGGGGGGGGPTYILKDEFDGTGAITAHTPDIYPSGSSWAIINGTFSDLDGGGVLKKSGSTALTRAVINVGVDSYVLEYCAKYTQTTDEHGGALFRSNSAGSDYWRIGMQYDSTRAKAKIATTATVGIYIDPSQQDNASKHDFTGVTGTYYTWYVVVDGSDLLIMDGDGNAMVRCFGVTKTGQYYVGVHEHQGAPDGWWEYIRVSAVPTGFWRKISIMGDSISNENTDWVGYMAARYKDSRNKLYNHAVIAHEIYDNMDAQTDQCEADAADFTIIALGTNDEDTPDCTSKYQENLQELWGTLGKPIYCMGVLPKNTTPNNRDTVNGWISAAVTAAAAAGVNCTYWNTDGWIDPVTDTSDGLHPTPAGSEKIATQVLARLP